MCPHCGIDSVIGDRPGYPNTTAFHEGDAFALVPRLVILLYCNAFKRSARCRPTISVRICPAIAHPATLREQQSTEAPTLCEAVWPGAAFHPDHGSQCTSKKFAQLCEELGATVDGAAGTSADNALAESFNAALKREVLQDKSRWTMLPPAAARCSAGWPATRISVAWRQPAAVRHSPAPVHIDPGSTCHLRETPQIYCGPACLVSGRMAQKRPGGWEVRCLPARYGVAEANIGSSGRRSGASAIGQCYDSTLCRSSVPRIPIAPYCAASQDRAVRRPASRSCTKKSHSALRLEEAW